MDYYQEMDYFWNQILIAFIVFQVIIVIIIGSRLTVFLKQNPRELLQEKYFKTVF